jgi:hypothetical protein
VRALGDQLLTCTHLRCRRTVAASGDGSLACSVQGESASGLWSRNTWNSPCASGPSTARSVTAAGACDASSSSGRSSFSLSTCSAGASGSASRHGSPAACRTHSRTSSSEAGVTPAASQTRRSNCATSVEPHRPSASPAAGTRHAAAPSLVNTQQKLSRGATSTSSPAPTSTPLAGCAGGAPNTSHAYSYTASLTHALPPPPPPAAGRSGANVSTGHGAGCDSSSACDSQREDRLQRASPGAAGSACSAASRRTWLCRRLLPAATGSEEGELAVIFALRRVRDSRSGRREAVDYCQSAPKRLLLEGWEAPQQEGTRRDAKG